MSTEKRPESASQLSFMTPRDVDLLARLHRLVAEAERLYAVPGATNPESGPIIRSPADLHEVFRPLMAELPQEQIRVANLSVRHEVLSTRMIHQGTISGSSVRIAEVFRPAIIENAAAIAVAHNHPSGDPEPSDLDYRITEELVDAGRLLQIQVMDHLVIARRGYVSMAERGRLVGRTR